MSWYKGGIGNLLDKDGIKKHLPSKIAKFYKRTVSLAEVDVATQDGWQISEQLQTRAHIIKEKPKYEQFQDLVWGMLAQMGFEYLTNDAATFTLKVNTDREQQIDVFAIDKEDVVIIAECKAANSNEPVNYDASNVINDIKDYRTDITKNLNQYFETKPKYVFLLCTSNYRIGSTAQERMKKENIVWLDKSRIEYFINLTTQLGVLAKYQFLGEILAGKEIPNLKNNHVSAIKTKLGGNICYSMMLHPSILLKLGYVLHRSENSTQGTYQRYVQKKRLNQITSYINNGGYFPNSILINFDESLYFNAAPQNFQPDDNISIGTVTLPNTYRSAFIIDGQHRLYGYANTDKIDTDVIPVVAFEKLSPQKQTNMFVDINTRSVQVKRNLLEALNGEIYWNSPNQKYALNALHAVLALKLNKESDSPLFNLLVIEEDKKQRDKATLAYFIDKALNSEHYFVIDRFYKNGTARGYGPLHADDLAEHSLEKGYKVLSYYYSQIKEQCPEQWEVMLTNVGLSTLSVILREFLEEKRIGAPDIFTNKNAKQIIEMIDNRVQTLCNELAKKEPTEVRAYITGHLGYSGTNDARRNFEKLIYDVDSTFNPEGLEAWIVEQSGIYSDATKRTLDILAPKIVSTVEEKLREEIGEDYYIELSTEIIERVRERRKQASIMREQGEDPAELLSQPLLELADIRPIVLKYWRNLGFEPIFKDRNTTGPNTKEERTKWLNKLVEVQNKIARNVNLSLSDFNAVNDVFEWFLKYENQEE